MRISEISFFKDAAHSTECSQNPAASSPETGRNIAEKAAVWRNLAKVANVSIKKRPRYPNPKSIRILKDRYFS